MRRDMELVRELLIEISEGKLNWEFDPAEYKDQKYIYHMKILQQAGLIEYEKMWEDMLPRTYVDSVMLTWAGNDYLDPISNKGVWSGIQEVVKSKGLEMGNIPFSVLSEYAKVQIKQLIGMD